MLASGFRSRFSRFSLPFAAASFSSAALRCILLPDKLISFVAPKFLLPSLELAAGAGGVLLDSKPLGWTGCKDESLPSMLCS